MTTATQHTAQEIPLRHDVHHTTATGTASSTLVMASNTKIYDIRYTATYLNAHLNLISGDSTSSNGKRKEYYAQGKILTTNPTILLRAGKSKSAPLVAAARKGIFGRHLVLGSASTSFLNADGGHAETQSVSDFGPDDGPDDDAASTATTMVNAPAPTSSSSSTPFAKADSTKDLHWTKMTRNENCFNRGDYDFTSSLPLPASSTSLKVGPVAKTRAYTWAVTKEKLADSFRTAYVCSTTTDAGDVVTVARMRSGGFTNLQKGGEIDVIVPAGASEDADTVAWEEMLMAGALGIWCAEAGWSAKKAY